MYKPVQIFLLLLQTHFLIQHHRFVVTQHRCYLILHIPKYVIMSYIQMVCVILLLLQQDCLVVNFLQQMRDH